MWETKFFLVFILAHLIGDFVLQTDRIAKIKAESLKGLSVHVLIITAVQMLLLSVFGINGIIAGAIGGIIHFLIDYIKYLSPGIINKNQALYFFVDQAMHVAVIYFLSRIFSVEVPLPEIYPVFIKYLIGIIILTYGSTVAVKMIVRDIYPFLKREAFFIKRERIFDGIISLALWGAGALPIIFGLCLAAAIFYPYKKYQTAMLRYDIIITITKYIILLIFSYLVAVFITQSKSNSLLF